MPNIYICLYLQIRPNNLIKHLSLFASPFCSFNTSGEFDGFELSPLKYLFALQLDYIRLPRMDTANPTLCSKTVLMKLPSARRTQKDTIYCRSAHRQLKQLLLTMSPVREAQSLEDIKKKPKRFSSKHFLSKLLTVDIMLIQQFVLAITNPNSN